MWVMGSEFGLTCKPPAFPPPETEPFMYYFLLHINLKKKKPKKKNEKKKGEKWRDYFSP